MDNLTIFTTLVFIFLYMMVTSENSELCTAWIQGCQANINIKPGVFVFNKVIDPSLY